MNRKKLKNILKKHFKDSTIDALLRGTRYPSMKKAIHLAVNEEIPLTAWISIPQYLMKEEEPTKEGNTSSTEKASA